VPNKGPAEEAGLKMHQRSCRVIQGLDGEFCTDLEEQNNSDTENIPEMDQSTINETPTVPRLKRKILRID
jgi:hypothetical protein